MFNEGYSAHQGEDLIRLDLCEEALRLGLLLASSSFNRPKVDALVALMALQAARMPARVDHAGDLVLLEDQDPSQWNQQLIGLGFHHFHLSISGTDVSRYHVESAIAATHAIRPVSWPRVLELYDELVKLDGGVSAVIRLNRAVAVARVHWPRAGLDAIKPLKLREYHLLLAAQGHFLLELGRHAEAAEAFRGALACPCSQPERRFLKRRLAAARQHHFHAY